MIFSNIFRQPYTNLSLSQYFNHHSSTSILPAEFVRKRSTFNLKWPFNSLLTTADGMFKEFIITIKTIGFSKVTFSQNSFWTFFMRRSFRCLTLIVISEQILLQLERSWIQTNRQNGSCIKVGFLCPHTNDGPG